MIILINGTFHLTSRRSLIAQHQAKVDEALEQARSLAKAMKTGKLAAEVGQCFFVFLKFIKQEPGFERNYDSFPASR